MTANKGSNRRRGEKRRFFHLSLRGGKRNGKCLRNFTFTQLARRSDQLLIIQDWLTSRNSVTTNRIRVLTDRVRFASRVTTGLR